MSSLPSKIKKCFKKWRIHKRSSIPEIRLQNLSTPKLEKRRSTVHDIPSLIEFTKEDKKRLEYTIIMKYLEDYL